MATHFVQSDVGKLYLTLTERKRAVRWAQKLAISCNKRLQIVSLFFITENFHLEFFNPKMSSKRAKCLRNSVEKCPILLARYFTWTWETARNLWVLLAWVRTSAKTSDIVTCAMPNFACASGFAWAWKSVLVRRKALEHNCCFVALASYGASKMGLIDIFEPLFTLLQLAPSINLGNIKINLSECWDSNLGLLGEKQECYLYDMQPTPVT